MVFILLFSTVANKTLYMDVVFIFTILAR